MRADEGGTWHCGGGGGGLWTLDVTGPVEMGGQWEDWRQESALASAAFWPIIFVIKKSKN